ncbi:MAG: DUF2157 domain-containing protein [Caldilineaceae bacterium]
MTEHSQRKATPTTAAPTPELGHLDLADLESPAAPARCNPQGRRRGCAFLTVSAHLEALLLTSGIFFFVAYNWDELTPGRFGLIGAIVVAVAIAHGGLDRLGSKDHSPSPRCSSVHCSPSLGRNIRAAPIRTRSLPAGRCWSWAGC